MGEQGFAGPLERIDETTWKIPRSYKPGMRVDGLIFANEELLEQARSDQAPEQVANVAFLPGIQQASSNAGYSLGLWFLHWRSRGHRSGGRWCHIPRRCGLRHQLWGSARRTDLTVADVQPKIQELVNHLFKRIPAGVGEGGPFKFSRDEIRKILAGRGFSEKARMGYGRRR